MRLPDACVLRTRNGKYLTLRGNLNALRKNAVRLTPRDAANLLSIPSGFADPLFTLSIEECPKRERRINPPLTSAEANALIALLKTQRVRAQIASLRKQADDADALARYYRAEADRMETLANTPS